MIDHVVVLPEFPNRDTKSAVQAQWRQIGGPVPVALTTASFYGAKTSFSGRWGNDQAGKEIQQGLADREIDLRASQSSDHWSTGFAHVWTEESAGTRTIAYSRGEFPDPAAEDIQQHRELFDACQILHLDGWAPESALSAAKRMKENGGLVVLDAGSKKPGMEELLPLVDVLVASDLFCGSWFGEPNVSLDRLRTLGCDAVVRTKGADGASYSDGELEFNAPAVAVTPVDTNGAGDIFSGAMLVGLSRGWDAKKTVSFANAVAGYACEHRGNSTLPNEKEVEELLR